MLLLSFTAVPLILPALLITASQSTQGQLPGLQWSAFAFFLATSAAPSTALTRTSATAPVTERLLRRPSPFQATMSPVAMRLLATSGAASSATCASRKVHVSMQISSPPTSLVAQTKIMKIPFALKSFMMPLSGPALSTVTMTSSGCRASRTTTIRITSRNPQPNVTRTKFVPTPTSPLPSKPSLPASSPMSSNFLHIWTRAASTGSYPTQPWYTTSPGPP